MNKKTQQIVGVVAILGLGYWAYTKYGKKKSFANLTAKKKNCKTYNGNISSVFVGANVGGGTVQSTGNGTTTICYN